MMGGILGASFLGLFEDTISLVPAMAFFIPLITATGGNVGIQSSSVVVQSLANKSGINNFSFQRLLKGLLIALINGIAISSIVFGFNVFIGEKSEIAIVVSIALFSVVILASFMGTITPLLLDKMGFNPALASGPFITTANDLLGLGVYFLIAHLLYNM
jgi:magnesium transporter